MGADLGGDFNTNEIEEAGFDPIPPADYDLALVSSERLPTKEGNGEYVKCVMEVLSGEYQGRKIFTNLNLWNPSETAVKIAKAELKHMILACNKLTIGNVAEIENIPFRATVIQKVNKKSGQIQNEVSKYHYEDTAQGTTQAVKKVAAANASTTKAPWANG